MQACTSVAPFTVMVHDDCDECEPNQVNLQAAAFARMAPASEGRVAVQYREVSACARVRVRACVRGGLHVRVWVQQRSQPLPPRRGAAGAAATRGERPHAAAAARRARAPHLPRNARALAQVPCKFRGNVVVGIDGFRRSGACAGGGPSARMHGSATRATRAACVGCDPLRHGAVVVVLLAVTRSCPCVRRAAPPPRLTGGGWVRMMFRNVNGPALAKAELVAGDTVLLMTNSFGAAWEASKLPVLPWSIRLTNVAGATLVLKCARASVVCDSSKRRAAAGDRAACLMCCCVCLLCCACFITQGRRQEGRDWRRGGDSQLLRAGADARLPRTHTHRYALPPLCPFPADLSRV
jgi:hypothetical protein